MWLLAHIKSSTCSASGPCDSGSDSCSASGSQQWVSCLTTVNLVLKVLEKSPRTCDPFKINFVAVNYGKILMIRDLFSLLPLNLKCWCLNTNLSVRLQEVPPCSIYGMRGSIKTSWIGQQQLMLMKCDLSHFNKVWVNKFSPLRLFFRAKFWTARPRTI